MDTKIATANYRLCAWEEIIRRRTESGLTVKEWCRQNNISRDQYFYWLRKVKEAAIKSAGTEFVEISPSACAAPGLPEAKAVLLIGDVSVLVNEGTAEDLMIRAIRAARHA